MSASRCSRGGGSCRCTTRASSMQAGRADRVLDHEHLRQPAAAVVLHVRQERLGRHPFEPVPGRRRGLQPEPRPAAQEGEAGRAGLVGANRRESRAGAARQREVQQPAPAGHERERNRDTQVPAGMLVDREVEQADTEYRHAENQRQQSQQYLADGRSLLHAVLSRESSCAWRDRLCCAVTWVLPPVPCAGGFLRSDRVDRFGSGGTSNGLTSAAVRLRHWPTLMPPSWMLHDPHPLQPPHLVTEGAHMRRICRFRPCVSTMRNTLRPIRRTLQGLVRTPEDLHAVGHAVQEVLGQRPVDGDHVFLFVLVLGAQDLVDDVAVVGEQDQAFGILVQAADRKDALRMADEVDDVAATWRSVVQVMPTGLFSAR